MARKIKELTLRLIDRLLQERDLEGAKEAYIKLVEAEVEPNQALPYALALGENPKIFAGAMKSAKGRDEKLRVFMERFFDYVRRGDLKQAQYFLYDNTHHDQFSKCALVYFYLGLLELIQLDQAQHESPPPPFLLEQAYEDDSFGGGGGFTQREKTQRPPSNSSLVSCINYLEKGSSLDSEEDAFLPYYIKALLRNHEKSKALEFLGKYYNEHPQSLTSLHLYCWINPPSLWDYEEWKTLGTQSLYHLAVSWDLVFVPWVNKGLELFLPSAPEFELNELYHHWELLVRVLLNRLENCVDNATRECWLWGQVAACFLWCHIPHTRADNTTAPVEWLDMVEFPEWLWNWENLDNKQHIKLAELDDLTEWKLIGRVLLDRHIPDFSDQFIQAKVLDKFKQNGKGFWISGEDREFWLHYNNVLTLPIQFYTTFHGQPLYDSLEPDEQWQIIPSTDYAEELDLPDKRMLQRLIGYDMKNVRIEPEDLNWLRTRNEKLRQK